MSEHENTPTKSLHPLCSASHESSERIDSHMDERMSSREIDDLIAAANACLEGAARTLASIEHADRQWNDNPALPRFDEMMNNVELSRTVGSDMKSFSHIVDCHREFMLPQTESDQD
jgi:hypothetical protein